MKTLAITAPLGALALAAAIAMGQATTAVAQADPDPALFAALMEEGEEVFMDECAFCHGNEGEGTRGPRLAGNAYLQANASTITLILGGYESHGMPAFRNALNIREIAAVVTFIRNSWGNEYGITTEATVAQYYNDGGSGGL